jgi:hypothetical protein
MPLIENLSSEEYHGRENTYSSSQLKDLLDDPDLFYKKYVAKTIEREETPAFDIGTYFHTAILEPHKLKLDCAVFEGIRRGKEWDKFKEDNKGKAIITKSEFETAKKLIESVKNSPMAMGRIGRGNPEISTFLDLFVCGSDIYCLDNDSILGKFGWEKAKKFPFKGTKITMKARADLLAEDFILDLKSTTGNAKSEYSMRSKISNYNYDLSASLYLDLFTASTGKTVSEFVWVFASKDYFNSKTYIASEDNILVGRAKWKKAVLNLAEGIQEDWKFQDTIGILRPQPHELEWIKEQGKDLL